MSARDFLAGVAKSVLVHRHALVPTRARTLAIGRGARLPVSFEPAFGAAAPAALDAALAAERWTEALRLADAWAARAPSLPEPRVVAGLLRLWPAAGAKTRPGLEGLIDLYAAPAGLRALEKAARDFPRSAHARLWLGLALLRRTDLPGAWRELDALCGLRPDWSWAFLIRSELGRVDVVYDRALRDLERAERLEPGNAWVHAFRARVLFQKDPGPAATAAMDRAVALAPRAGWLRGWRADARRKLGDLAGARADLQVALRLEPDYDRLYLWSGKVLRALGRASEAERVLTRGLRTCPHFEKAYAERARARLSLGRVEEALDDLERAVAVNHRHNAFFNWTAEIDPPSPARSEVLLRLAAHAEARPRSARAWAWLGEALTQAGQPEAGLAALDRALALDASRPWLRSWRGEALLRLGRLAQAESELDLAVKADPRDGRARAFRGRVRFLRGRPSGAASDLEKAASDALVEYSWIYHWRAEAKSAAGDRAGALSDAETAASLEPGRREFRALRDGLRRAGVPA